ncbi:MAG TPA: FAD-dependent oxidoreductase [Pyrinomonadaceae bacterium]|nr:FAD-dependent oxidoreductase [Pyrinomonadaceae bacterium]
MRKSDEGSTVSIWEATEDLLEGGAAVPDSTEVCIVGGGIAGLTTAYLLSKAGSHVTVVDDGLIGGGETCRTTAHLSNALDDRIYRIEEWHGEDKAKLAVESHGRAIDTIEKVAKDESIDCDFLRVDGYLFEADDGRGDDDLDKEFDAARRCGLDVEWVETQFGRSMRFPRQGQFHVLKYLRGLVDVIQANGGRLISNTRVTEWEGGDAPVVKTSRGDIQSDRIVLATNYPLMSKMFAELPAYRTYAIGVEIPKGSVERALYWDNADPYIYVRTQVDDEGEILIVGGEDHRTAQANDGEERFRRLEEWTRRHFSSAGPVKYRWSGQFMETHDGLGFLGQYSDDEPNVFLITGDSGMGMTHGTIGGMIVSDLIVGKQNPWVDVYLPGRIATQSIKEAVPEIIASTVPYKDWVTGGDIDSVDDLKPGEGGILRDGLSKIACYRDDEGKLHKRSAVCTHMGCIVRFNSLERTWDCPCHGSRFSTNGDPINAPAIAPLGKAE